MESCHWRSAEMQKKIFGLGHLVCLRARLARKNNASVLRSSLLLANGNLEKEEKASFNARSKEKNALNQRKGCAVSRHRGWEGRECHPTRMWRQCACAGVRGATTTMQMKTWRQKDAPLQAHDLKIKRGSRPFRTAQHSDVNSRSSQPHSIECGTTFCSVSVGYIFLFHMYVRLLWNWMLLTGCSCGSHFHLDVSHPIS